MRNYISNTSCLILLNKLNLLNLLEKLYGRVLITEVVKDEYGDELPEFIEIKKMKNLSAFHALEQFIDSGEASTLSLGMEIQGSTLILDDRKARKTARDLKLQYTGTLGILMKARERGYISALKPVLEDLQKNGMWVSNELIHDMLEISGETLSN